jgi:hypothetical protein
MRMFKLWTNARADAARAACEVCVAEIRSSSETQVSTSRLKRNGKA